MSDTMPTDAETDLEFSDAWAHLSKSARKKLLKQQQRASSHPRPPKPALDVRPASEPPTAPAPPMQRLPLLICGIGNPGPAYANTLHSAGQTLVQALATKLGYPPFAKERAWGNGLVSRSPDGARDWTLWLSTSYMNDSGAGVAAACREWTRLQPTAGGRVVVVHDELERALGSVSVRTTAGASAKGHNGLKSVMASLGGRGFVRLGVGIGRPVSRDREDVARYVLRKMTEEERGAVEGCVDVVVGKLEELERG